MTNDTPSSEQDIYDSGVEMAYKANDALTDALKAQARLSAGEENKSLNPSDRAALIDQVEKAHARYDRYNDAVGSLIGPQVFKEKPSIAPRHVEKAPDVKKPIERVAEYPPRGGHDFFRNLIPKVIERPTYRRDGRSIGEKLMLYNKEGLPELQTSLESQVPKPEETILEKVLLLGSQWAESEIKNNFSDRRVRQAIGYLAELNDRITEAQETGSITKLRADSLKRFIAAGFCVRSEDYFGSDDYYRGYVSNPESANNEGDQERFHLRNMRWKMSKLYQDKIKGTTKGDRNSEFIEFIPPVKSGAFTDRIYISFKTSYKVAEQGIQAWMQALENTRLIDRVQFKVGLYVEDRCDHIVIYPTEGLKNEDVQQLIETFISLCPEEMRSSQPPMTGIDLAPGISYATEPEYIALMHKLLDSKNNRTSFGALMSGLSEIAMQLAYVEVGRAMPEGQGPSQMKVIDTAEQIFQQYLTLLDLNPDSFVPNSRGGKLPDWAQHIRDTQARRPQ